MVQDVGVGFAGFVGGEVGWVGGELGGGGGVPGFEVRDVALDVARRAGAAGGGEADVGGHVGWGGKMWLGGNVDGWCSELR